MNDDDRKSTWAMLLQSAAVVVLLVLGYWIGTWHERGEWQREATRFGHGFVDDDGDFHWGPPHVWPGDGGE